MTATSAQGASQTPSTVARTVLLPGSPATYANRAFLKGLGLRWDPEGHRWHGTVSAENVRALREQLCLQVRVFGSLDVAPEAPIPPQPPQPSQPKGPASPLVHDGSRTHLEARIAFPAEDEELGEVAVQGHRFSLLEITSGLPDDSREADDRAAARHFQDLRGRVKAARAVVAITPGLAETLRADWKRAAGFCARFGISEMEFRHGVPSLVGSVA